MPILVENGFQNVPNLAHEHTWRRNLAHEHTWWWTTSICTKSAWGHHYCSGHHVLLLYNINM